MRFVSVLSAALVLSTGAWAQGSSDNPNLLMGEAIELYEAGMAASGSDRKALMTEVDAILDRIRTDFPESVPAEFMRSADRLGIISQSALEAELADRHEGLP